jgi:heme exporter protein A
MPDCLSGEDLSCIRGERLVFTQLSFRLEAGGALVLRGPNGSGKSSLLRLIAGLGRPVTGAIAWNGASIARDRAAHRARTAYAGHADAVKPALTVAENLCFWTALRGSVQDATAALARLGLDRHAAVPGRFLSSGEKRRLALATLAASGAPVWLLDEPTVGLDAASLTALERLIAEHRRNGGMVVLSTHVDLGLGDADTLDLGAYAVARPTLAAYAP